MGYSPGERERGTDGFEERSAVLQFGGEGDATTLEGRDGLLRLLTHAVLILQRNLELLQVQAASCQVHQAATCPLTNNTLLKQLCPLTK